MGTSVTIIVRDMSSISSRNAAPRHIVAGRSFSWSDPTSIRPMCGMISPIHPIIPLIDTAAEVISVHDRIISSLSLLVFIPSDLDSSSPIARMFSLHLSSISISIPMIMGMAAISTSWLDADDMLPISQYIICGSLSYGSASILHMLVSAVNSDPIAIPASTIMIVSDVFIVFPIR